MNKNIGERWHNHKCKDNDNYIKVVHLDGELDELWFSTTKRNWVVIGIDDIKAAIKKAKKKLK